MDLAALERRAPAYRGHDPARRRYWEHGANRSLSAEERATLTQRAAAGVRYEPSTRRSDSDVPRRADGRIDHGVVIRAIQQFVRHGMPEGHVPGRPSPRRELGWILRTGVGGANAHPPPDTEGLQGEPGWVCINAVTLAAGLLRELGYPVRECNVYLAQNRDPIEGWRGAMYQEAALQVWFEDGWHWVDPYLGIFDPASTRDDSGIYKCDAPQYWDGTTTPTDWRPARDTRWRPFGPDGQLGCDLHRRFYPKRVVRRGRESPEATAGESHAPQPRVSRLSSDLERPAGTVTSGVVIRTRAEGVTLSLADRDGRLSDSEQDQVPGALRIAAGTVVPYGAPGIALDDPAIPYKVGPSGLEHFESVFFGTRSLLASWEEVATHELSLHVRGRARQVVALEQEVTRGDHLVTVVGLPAVIVIPDELLVVPFTVTIDPVDSTFHTLFDRLIRNDVVTPAMYWPAVDSLQAIRRRAIVSAADREPAVPSQRLIRRAR